jgi:hypothetical protein
MNEWVIWPIGIGLWVAIGWMAFWYFEIYAFRHTKDPGSVTLSRWLYTIGSKFPLFIIIGVGAIAYFLGVMSAHLAWHWCPPGSISGG